MPPAITEKETVFNFYLYGTATSQYENIGLVLFVESVNWVESCEATSEGMHVHTRRIFLQVRMVIFFLPNFVKPKQASKTLSFWLGAGQLFLAGVETDGVLN